jgi:hypothetical protein
MSDNSTKAICTTAIWIATAFIFVFGVFHFNWNGELSGLLWTLVALTLAIVPGMATRAIWRSPASERRSELPPK